MTTVNGAPALSQPAKDLSSALKTKCDRIRTLLSQEYGRSVLAHHEVGKVVLGVRDSNKFGQGGVKHLASQLGLDPATLHDYANVAQRWSGPELKKLVSRQGKHRLPLSWSHLVELARLTDDGRRAELVDATLEEGLSVKELRQRISSRDPAHTETSEPDADSVTEDASPPSLINGLKEMTTLAKSWADRQPRWEKDVIKPLLAPGATRNGDEVKMLHEAKEAQTQLRESIDANIEQIDKCLAHLADGGKKQPGQKVA